MQKLGEKTSGTDTLKKAYVCNIFTAILVLFSLAWMFSGIIIGNGHTALISSRWEMFKFYTIDSNALMGISAIVSACAQKAVLSGKRTYIRPGIYVLKLSGVVGVTLTMLVTVFVLTSTIEGGWRAAFSNSTLFMHLINPLISIFVFLLYERTASIRWKYTWFGIISVAVYAAYYAVACILHSTDNVVDSGYDWYGFARGGLRSGLTTLPLLLLGSYVICFVLWLLNRQRRH